MAGGDIEMNVFEIEEEYDRPPNYTRRPRGVTVSLPLDRVGVIMEIEQHMITVLREMGGDRIRGMRLASIHLDFDVATLFAELRPRRDTDLRVLFEDETIAEPSNSNRNRKIFLFINLILALICVAILFCYTLYVHFHCSFDQ